jgi:hypothetical protein
MSGVSITSGPGIDIDAVVSGGPEFIQRMSDFKSAKEAFEKSLADLALGKQAREALDEASRIRDQAKAERDVEMDKLLKHVAAIKADTNDWASKTRGEALATREEAQAQLKAAEAKHQEASATLADAQAKHDAINAKLAALKAKFAAGHAGLMADIEAI